MEWWLRWFDRNKLLISDRPLLAYPGTRYPCGIPLDNPDCLIALPIAPNIVFFASANRETRTEIRRRAPSKIVHAINTETVMSCVDFVYGCDDSLGSLFDRNSSGRPKDPLTASPNDSGSNMRSDRRFERS
jgi:hypothetical protein